MPFCHTDPAGWTTVLIRPFLIHLVCSGADTYQHGICMQSWSWITQAGRLGMWGAVAGRGLWGGLRRGHSKDHLYFIDLSISVNVHVWKVGEGSPCLRGLPVCSCSPCTIDPVPSLSHSSSSSSPMYRTGRLILIHLKVFWLGKKKSLRIPGSGLIWLISKGVIIKLWESDE